MEILPGTLELLVLRTLELEPMHGVGVAARIEQVTRGAFIVKPGSLFPALRRLEQSGWVKGEWRPSENNPAGTRSTVRAGAGGPDRE